MPDTIAEQLSKQIGARARVARKAAGMTQAEVAEAADLAEEVYGRLERGGMLPSLTTLVRLAGVLGTTPSALLENSAVATPSEKKSAPRPSRELRLLVRKLEGATEAELRRVRLVVSAMLKPTPSRSRRAEPRRAGPARQKPGGRR